MSIVYLKKNIYIYMPCLYDMRLPMKSYLSYYIWKMVEKFKTLLFLPGFTYSFKPIRLRGQTARQVGGFKVTKYGRKWESP